MYCSSFKNISSRREFLSRMAYGLGTAALSSLFTRSGHAASSSKYITHSPAAKRVIFLFQSGGPSHLDLFDPKPEMKKRFGQDIPESIFGGQRITGMVSNQDRFLVVPSKYKFNPSGQCGMELSEVLPWTQRIADEICLIRSVHSEAINHDPAITFIQTG